MFGMKSSHRKSSHASKDERRSERDERRSEREERRARESARHAAMEQTLQNLQSEIEQQRSKGRQVNSVESEPVNLKRGDARTTFQGVVTFITKEAESDPNAAYTARSVANTIASLYEWVVVDRNRPIKLPLTHLDEEPLTMYAEGTVISSKKNTPSMEDLAKSMALSFSVDDDASSAVISTVGGPRRRRATTQSEASESITSETKDEWTRGADPPAPYRGPAYRRPTVAIPMYQPPSYTHQAPGYGGDGVFDYMTGEASNPPSVRDYRQSAMGPGMVANGGPGGGVTPAYPRSSMHAPTDSPQLVPRTTEPPRFRVRPARRGPPPPVRAPVQEEDEEDDRL